ncbi:MAG: Uncharacterised protein [Marinobacterium sp. xm-d-530]|nr:MAG: Uncharacterised protein [Marinobacterium sp. xm-d-530]
MRNRSIGDWVEPFHFTEEQIKRIRSVESENRTTLTKTQWDLLIPYLEQAVAQHRALPEEEDSVPYIREELRRIENYLSKSLKVLFELHEREHSLIDQHFYLANKYTLPRNINEGRDGKSSYEVVISDLLNGITDYRNHLQEHGPKKQGASKNYTYTFFLVELMKFLVIHDYPISPKRSKNTPFHKLSRVLFEEAFNVDSDPISHIQTAYDKFEKYLK